MMVEVTRLSAAFSQTPRQISVSRAARPSAKKSLQLVEEVEGLMPARTPPCRGYPRLGRLARCADPLGERGGHERIEIAVEDTARVGGLHVRPQVLDHLIGLQDVGADLVAPADVALGGLDLGRRCFASLQLDLVEPRAQHLPGLLAILMLRALVLAGDRYAGGDV